MPLCHAKSISRWWCFSKHLCGLSLLWLLSFSSPLLAGEVISAWPENRTVTLYIPDVTSKAKTLKFAVGGINITNRYVEQLRDATGLNLQTVSGTWDKVYQGFLNNPDGIILFIANTPERAKELYFSPAFYSPYVYKVRQGDSPIRHLDQLGNKTLAVIGGGSVAEQFAMRHVPSDQIYVFNDVHAMDLALATGTVDVALANFDHFGFEKQSWSRVRITSRLAEDVPEFMNQGNFATHQNGLMPALLEEILSISLTLPAFNLLKASVESYQLTPSIQHILDNQPYLTACVATDKTMSLVHRMISAEHASGVIPRYFELVVESFGRHMHFFGVPTLADHQKGVDSGLCDFSYRIVDANEDLHPYDGERFASAEYLYLGKKGKDQSPTRLAVPLSVWMFSKENPEFAGKEIVVTPAVGQFEPLLKDEVDQVIVDTKTWVASKETLLPLGIEEVGPSDIKLNARFYAKSPDVRDMLEMGYLQLPRNTFGTIFGQAVTEDVIQLEKIVFPWLQIATLGVVSAIIIFILGFYLQLSRKADQAHTQALEHTKRFLANMSHELRTPMNSILGMSELMSRDEKSDPLTREQADIIYRSGQHMLHLLNDVLDMSKVEAGEIKLENIPVDIERLIRDVAIQWKNRSHVKGIQLQCPRTFKVHDGYRSVDPTRLMQVLSNLVSNAIKFTSKGFVAVDVIQQDDGTLLFRVEDSGIGIEKEQLARIFERFKQADESVNRRFGGTGLGLSISRALVDLLGGDLNVTSQKGRGSTFEFTLALPVMEKLHEPEVVEAVAEVLPNPPKESKVVSLDNQASGDKRLMVVDDVATNRFILGMMLERQFGDIKIDEAESVDAAMALLQQHKYQAVFTDINMPDKTGIDLLKLIKKQGIDGVNPHMPVIACSGEETTDELEMMFSACLMKPVSIEPLKAVMAELGLNFHTVAKPKPVAVDTPVNASVDEVKAFFTDLAKTSNTENWFETVVNPCLGFLDILMEDMRFLLARGEMQDIQQLALHMNTLGSLLGSPELKMIAMRLFNEKPLSTQLALECYLDLGRCIKKLQIKRTVA